MAPFFKEWRLVGAAEVESGIAMHNTQMALYVLGELAIFLLLVSIGLAFHARGLKKLIASLESKVVNLRKVLQSTKDAALLKFEELQKAAATQNYLAQVDQQIQETRRFHQAQLPDRDISLDLLMGIAPARQTASLRNALLLAEKEAMLASDTSTPDWDVLQAKFQQLLVFFQGSSEAAAPAEPADGEQLAALQATIESQQKQIANLEKFKKLFFELEAQWQKARSSAEQTQHQLSAMASVMGAGEDFDLLLNQYLSSYNGLETVIVSGVDAGGGIVQVAGAPAKTVVIDRREEVDALRRMASDQYALINELKRKLYEARSDEQRQAAIGETHEELGRYQRFLQEAETCIEQLEAELSDVRSRSEAAQAENERLKRDMRMLDGHVEQQDALKRQLQEAEAEAAAQRARLQEAQQELLNLQAQHIELEERYLELRAASI